MGKVTSKKKERAASTSPRRTRDTEATKAQILNAAEEEFARHGLSGTRTEAIAAKTGVTKAMIFYHFGNKEKLYRAVLKRPCSDVIQAFETLDLEQQTAEVALSRLIRAAIEYCVAYPHRGKVLFHEANQNQGRYFQKEGGWQPAIDYISNLLERGVAEGSFRPLDPFITTAHIMGICSFYFDARENLKYAAPEKDLLSPDMVQAHIDGAIALVIAGVKNH